MVDACDAGGDGMQPQEERETDSDRTSLLARTRTVALFVVGVVVALGAASYRSAFEVCTHCARFRSIVSLYGLPIQRKLSETAFSKVINAPREHRHAWIAAFAGDLLDARHREGLCLMAAAQSELVADWLRMLQRYSKSEFPYWTNLVLKLRGISPLVEHELQALGFPAGGFDKRQAFDDWWRDAQRSLRSRLTE